MKKELMVIGGYPNTEASLQLLKESILSLNSNFDVMLVTHYPVPVDIQELVKYYIYDVRNESITNDYYYVWWDTTQFYAELYPFSDVGIHGYAIFSSLRNVVDLMHRHYDSFFYSESDCIWHPTDIAKLKQIGTQVREQNKKAWLNCRAGDNNAPQFSGWVFYFNMQFFKNVFKQVKSKQEYIDLALSVNAPNGTFTNFEEFLYYCIQGANELEAVLIDRTQWVGDVFPNSKIGIQNRFQEGAYVVGSTHFVNALRVDGTPDRYAILFTNNLNHEGKALIKELSGFVSELPIYVDGNLLMTVTEGIQYMCVPIEHNVRDTIEVKIGTETRKYITDTLKNSKSFVRLKA